MILLDYHWSSQRDRFSRSRRDGEGEKSNHFEMTNEYMFIAILHMTTLLTSLTSARAPLVSSDNFPYQYIELRNFQSVRSRKNFVK